MSCAGRSPGTASARRTAGGTTSWPPPMTAACTWCARPTSSRSRSCAPCASASTTRTMPGDAVPTRFVILAAPRTGSNMLVTLLGSHPDVLCHHELFNDTGIYYAVPLRGGGFDLGTMEDRLHDP